MVNWFLIACLGLVFYAVYRHSGTWDAVGVDAAIYLLMPYRFTLSAKR